MTREQKEDLKNQITIQLLATYLRDKDPEAYEEFFRPQIENVKRQMPNTPDGKEIAGHVETCLTQHPMKHMP
ncbi:hypothetical protein [Methylorubrum extorquens]|uniref:hypothetical protein n=1 Tax=Methylorubrum extorquens TaxID=408 RepID=UPI00209CFC66|nr:hypothetical protein [Methylorubrum extorquens]MCP1540025.1 hypothetical protein [Methylorubrum extorquens]